MKQDRCAMKIGTDAVLLATVPQYSKAPRILDIGTGTGVISLMLAQQFPDSLIDAVEIDFDAYEQAVENFASSPWKNNLRAFHTSIEEYESIQLYDLIVSNPPYFINSLRSGSAKKDTARHASDELLHTWLTESKALLSKGGLISFILPFDQLEEATQIAASCGLFLHKSILIRSFPLSVPVRTILLFSAQNDPKPEQNFIIYEKPGMYSAEYKSALSPYLTIF